MSTKRRRSKTVFKSFLTCVNIPETNIPLSTRGLNNIDAVSPAVTSRDTLWLAVKTKTHATQIVKLTHGSLWCKGVHVTPGHAHRNGTLDTPMCRRSVGSKSW